MYRAMNRVSDAACRNSATAVYIAQKKVCRTSKKFWDQVHACVI